MFLVFFSVPMMFVSVVGTHDDSAYYFTTLTVLSGDCVSSQNCVTSGNFPSNYGNRERCSVATPKGFICATSFHTESGFDKFIVSDTEYDGTASTVLGSDGCFHGGHDVHCAQRSLRRLLAELCDQWNFPSNYGNQEGCLIATPAGFISATSFHTEEGYDHFTVNDMEFDGTCGPQDVQVYARDVLIWTTDWSVTEKGWEICWSQRQVFGVQGRPASRRFPAGWRRCVQAMRHWRKL